MKNLVIALGLISCTYSFACSTYEAQFSSIVKEVEAIEGEPYACWLKLDINLAQDGQSYRPHMMCPLQIDEVYEGRIYSQHCQLQPGDEVSGYLVKPIGGRIELE